MKRIIPYGKQEINADDIEAVSKIQKRNDHILDTTRDSTHPKPIIEATAEKKYAPKYKTASSEESSKEGKTPSR